MPRRSKNSPCPGCSRILPPGEFRKGARNCKQCQQDRLKSEANWVAEYVEDWEQKPNLYLNDFQDYVERNAE